MVDYLKIWQGVVEQRQDPLMLGRCRVRILGHHTNDLNLIPTNDLPWAYPSQPITSAAISGVGHTPMGPVEGTWVFGFFRDGEDCQEPVMIGTFGGIPQEGPTPSLGFNDSSGVYPLATEIGKPDTNSLARGNGATPAGPLNGEQHTSLMMKRKAREKGIPTALAGKMTSAIPNSGNSALYNFTPWNEPNPRYGGIEDSDTEYLDQVTVSSIYPHNHVRQSESGHVEEWDDTPDAERLHRYHMTGTFEEIQPDGTRVVKIVGNDYEIVAGSQQITIKGASNVTIEDDCRLLYQGDLVQEVYGDYHINVHGDMRTKIGGNEAREVINNRKTVININDDLLVGKDALWNVGGDQVIDVGATMTYTVNDNTQMWLLGSGNNITSAGSLGIASATVLDINAALNVGISSGAKMDITSIGVMNINNAIMNTITAGISTITNGISITTTVSYNKITAWPILLN
jgi:hypothetical protein